MQDVRIVLVGDSGVGKSSLIATLLSESFQTDVPKVVEQVTIAASSTPERVTTHIIDTHNEAPQLRTQIESASVVCIVFDANLPMDCVWKWLETIHAARATVPVVLVSSKIDLRSGSKANKALSKQVRPFMVQYKQIESCIECSAKHQLNVSEVFYFAQKAVLHPMAPLYDSEQSALSRDCERALGRIFTLWDSDRDGILSDDDLIAFQKHCFSSSLQPTEISRVRQTIAAGDPSGAVTANGFTLSGFLRLFLKFLHQGKTELVWTVLRRFGYSNSFELRLPESNLAKNKDSVVQLSSAGETFVRQLFTLYDKDRDGCLSATESAELFAFVPERARPWNDYRGVECNAFGFPTLSGFLSKWQALTHESADTALDVLVWLGADVDSVADLVELVPRGSWAARKLLPFCVVGADGVGKTALLQALTGRYRDASTGPKDAVSAALPSDVVFALPAASAAKGRYVLVREVTSGGPAGLDLSPFFGALVAFDAAAPASYDVAMSFFEALDRARKPVLFLATKTDVTPLSADHRVRARLAELGLQPVLEAFILSQAQVTASHLREQKDAVDAIHAALAALVADPALGLSRSGAATGSSWRRLLRGGIAISMVAAVAVSGLAIMRKYRK